MAESINPLRRLLERGSRRLVFRRHLPARFGGAPLWVTPSAALGYWRTLDHRNWRDLYEFAAHEVKTGATVWDVGANLGVFAFSAAHGAGPAGRVLAIEPDPWLCALMRRSSRERAVRAPVEILCAAVSSTLDLQGFATTARSRSGSHLAHIAPLAGSPVGETSEQHPVVTVTLDWLAARRPPPQVLKIDVEGAELLVLEGAANLLRQHRPTILLEVHDCQADAVTALLHGQKYILHDIGPGWAGRAVVPRTVYNTLALPAEACS